MTAARLKRLEDAVRDAGGALQVARRMTERYPDRYAYPQLVSGWFHSGVPGHWVIPLENALEGRMSRHDIRPDIFGPNGGPPVKEGDGA